MYPRTAHDYKQDNSKSIAGAPWSPRDQSRSEIQRQGFPRNSRYKPSIQKLHGYQDGIALDPELLASSAKVSGKLSSIAKSTQEGALGSIGHGINGLTSAFNNFIKPGPVGSGTAKTRFYALWAALAGTGVMSLKSIMDLAAYPLNKGKKKVAFLWKAAETLLGLTMCKGLYDTVSNNGSKAFGKMSTVLAGLGGFAALKLFNGFSEGKTNILSKAINVVPEAKDIAQGISEAAKFGSTQQAVVPNTMGNFS